MQTTLPLSELLLTIDFDPSNSWSENLTNFGQLGPGRYATLGQESQLRLPLPHATSECIVGFDASPFIASTGLQGQAFMFAIDDRLLGTVRLTERTVFAFRFPENICFGSQAVLSIVNLSSKAPEGVYTYRDGQPMGMELHSVRLYRLSPGTSKHSSLPANAAGLSPIAARKLAERFDTLGLDCQFGIVQRKLGSEPLGLLRFVASKTAHLAEGLVRKFARIEAEEDLEFHHTDKPHPTYRVFQKYYALSFDTERLVEDTDATELRREQSRRFMFLHREFLKDIEEGSKIFVLVRNDPLFQEEAFALFCALRLSGPASLLWTTPGDPALAGQVDQLEPGFLRGHLGTIDSDGHADIGVWTSVLRNASRLIDAERAQA
jgi:hypothetical protein